MIDTKPTFIQQVTNTNKSSYFWYKIKINHMIIIVYFLAIANVATQQKIKILSNNGYEIKLHT